jgi:hypothetical protein
MKYCTHFVSLNDWCAQNIFKLSVMMKEIITNRISVKYFTLEYKWKSNKFLTVFVPFYPSYPLSCLPL